MLLFGTWVHVSVTNCDMNATHIADTSQQHHVDQQSCCSIHLHTLASAVFHRVLVVRQCSQDQLYQVQYFDIWLF